MNCCVKFRVDPNGGILPPLPNGAALWYSLLTLVLPSLCLYSTLPNNSRQVIYSVNVLGPSETCFLVSN